MIRVRPRLVTWAQHLHSAASQWSSAEAQTQLFCHRVLQGPLVEKLPVNSSIAAANVGFTSLVTPQLPDWLVDIRQYPRKTPTANLLDAELQSLSPSASAFVASTHEPDSPSVAVENSHSWPRAASRGYSIRPGGLCWAAATTFTTTTINHTPTPNTFTSPLQRAFSSDPSPSSDDAESPHKVASSDEGAHEKLVLYRGRWIKPLRLLVRLKILQLTGVAVLAVPIVQYTQHGHVSLGTYAAVGLVVSGAAIASAALWFYSRRYIGELSLLLPEKRAIRLSTLDFWGRRQDTDVSISRLVPPLKGMGPAALREVAQHAFVPLEVTGDRQYILSLRHGDLLHKDALIDLLTKDNEEA